MKKKTFLGIIYMKSTKWLQTFVTIAWYHGIGMLPSHWPLPSIEVMAFQILHISLPHYHSLHTKQLLLYWYLLFSGTTQKLVQYWMIMRSEDACHAPASELIPLQHTEERGISAPQFRHLKGRQLLVGPNYSWLLNLSIHLLNSGLHTYIVLW